MEKESKEKIIWETCLGFFLLNSLPKRLVFLFLIPPLFLLYNLIASSLLACYPHLKAQPVATSALAAFLFEMVIGKQLCKSQCLSA